MLVVLTAELGGLCCEPAWAGQRGSRERLTASWPSPPGQQPFRLHAKITHSVAYLRAHKTGMWKERLMVPILFWSNKKHPSKPNHNVYIGKHFSALFWSMLGTGMCFKRTLFLTKREFYCEEAKNVSITSLSPHCSSNWYDRRKCIFLQPVSYPPSKPL